MKRLCLVLGLLSLFVSSAVAGPRDDALLKKKEGERLLAAGDLAGALARYEEGYALWADPVFDLARGNVFVKLRRYEEAKLAYERYLSATKDKRGKAEVQKALDGLEVIFSTTLRCESAPSGAEVFLDSRLELAQGKTPLSFHLTPGKHRVFFVLEGYRIQEEIIDIAAGTEIALAAAMRPAPLWVAVESKPKGASLFVDGAPAGTAPATLELSPGMHELEARASGFRPWRERVEGKAGDELALVATLREQASGLLVTTTPAEATLSIDGREGSFRSGEELPLSPGIYTLRAEAPGFWPAKAEVRITPKTLQELSITLEAQTARLSLRASMPGAVASFDGGAPVSLPLGPTEIVAGIRALRVSAPGALPFDGTLEVPEGGALSASVELTPLASVRAKRWMIAAGAVGGASLGALALHLVVADEVRDCFSPGEADDDCDARAEDFTRLVGASNVAGAVAISAGAAAVGLLIPVLRERLTRPPSRVVLDRP